MKKSIFVSMMLVFCISLSAQVKKMAEFQELNHDFGTVKEGEGNGGKITNVFKFTNISTTPIFIESARASCGCTTPQFDSSKPIAPGEVGEIPVTYNTNGRPGTFSKIITVVLKNGQDEKYEERLGISGKVTAKEQTGEAVVLPVEKLTPASVEKEKVVVKDEKANEPQKEGVKTNRHHRVRPKNTSAK